jgi:diguanylate cyclase
VDRDTLYHNIGTFLAQHSLWPGPENYALIYQLFVEQHSPAAKAVKAATSDGIRLSQRDANEIMKTHGLQPSPPRQQEQGAALMVAAKRQMDELTAILEASQAETERYGRDLEEGAAKLESAGKASVATLLSITRAMVERTKVAEQQLSAAREETQALREKLAEVEEEARSDPLTRLPNRRAFEERLAELKAEGNQLSLAICDIDRFKRINDQYGHAVGDRVLRSVADLLQNACVGHMVARLGGEEFVVLFEGLEPPQAAEILDQARELLAAKHFRLRETDAPLGQITFSAGIACGLKPADVGPMHRADALLYQAKNSGRNRICHESC